MNPEIEHFYQEIGQHAVSAAPELAGRLLVYAEVAPGAISASMFYVRGGGKPVRFRFCPDEMRNLIYEFWEKWRTTPGNRQWTIMSYVIEDDGTFDLHLTYADQIDENEGEPDRRPRAIQKYFGDIPIDYSNPR